MAAYWGQRVADRHAARVGAERRRLAGLADRADKQHALLLAGDERDVFGEFPPDQRVGEFHSARA
jgi:hypothetical protein